MCSSLVHLLFKMGISNATITQLSGDATAKMCFAPLNFSTIITSEILFRFMGSLAISPN